MPSPAVNLWPRWLRITVVGIATAAVISGGWLTYRHFVKPVYLTVAAGSLDGEALSLIWPKSGNSFSGPAQKERLQS